MYLFLHIGFEKTGSTSFQESWANLDPKELTSCNFAAQAGFISPVSSSDLTTLICNKKTLGKLRRPHPDFLSELTKYLTQNRDKNILFSDEHISSRILSKDEIHILKNILTIAGHQLIVLIVNRERDEWLRSKYAQAVKGGYYGSFIEYINNGGARNTNELETEKTISLWRSAEVLVEEFSYSKNIVNDLFLYISSISNSNLPLPDFQYSSNSRLTARKIDILIQINKFFRRFDLIRKTLKRFIVK